MQSLRILRDAPSCALSHLWTERQCRARDSNKLKSPVTLEAVAWMVAFMISTGSALQVDDIRLRQAKAANLAVAVGRSLENIYSGDLDGAEQYEKMTEIHGELRVLERDLVDTTLAPGDAQKLTASYEDEANTLTAELLQIGGRIDAISEASRRDQLAFLTRSLVALEAIEKGLPAPVLNDQQTQGASRAITDKASLAGYYARSLNGRLAQINATMTQLASKDSSFERGAAGIAAKIESTLASIRTRIRLAEEQRQRDEAAQREEEARRAEQARRDQAETDGCMRWGACIGLVALVALYVVAQLILGS